MYNTETVIKTFALDILRHLYVYLLYFHKNMERYLRGAYSIVLVYKVPNRVGWHAMCFV